MTPTKDGAFDRAGRTGLAVSRSLTAPLTPSGAAHRTDELARVLGRLSDKERLAVVRRIARINRDWEVLETLALLAERLQEKVVDLEARLKQAQPSGSSERPAAGRIAARPRFPVAAACGIVEAAPRAPP